MDNKIRLDRYLCESGIGSRSEVKKYISKGMVTLGGNVVRSPKAYIDITRDNVFFRNEKVIYEKFVYYIIDKPQGYVSAGTDSREKCVTELAGDTNRLLSPAGRLDKDTSGLIILTDDGDMIHNIISPKRHVDKLYIAGLAADITTDDINIFKSGITLSDDTNCLSASLKAADADDALSIFENAGHLTDAEYFAYITIHEGKYHQVKRMFAARGNKVLSLRRLKIGELSLGNNSECGNVTKVSKSRLTDSLN